MSEQQLRGVILTPDGFVDGQVTVGRERIVAVDGVAVDEATARAACRPGVPLIVPGFIDLHVHGGGGRDVMDAGDAITTIAAAHVRCGTTSLLATTMTAPLDEIEAALSAVAASCGQRSHGCARVLGVHLEGPYINPERLGAQPAFATPASIEQIRSLNRLAPLRVITMAPEMPGHLELITALRGEGFLVQIGHSAGSYDDGVAALQHGATGFTHLFNAMTGLHHREPGMVGAALAHAQHAELIPDLLHVHPGAIHAALRAIPCVYCVSDATAAATMPDGDYRLGRHRVLKCMGGVRLPDGRLAGSALTLDQALRNLVGLGLPLAEASARVSRIAADYLGLAERGRIVTGAYADLVALDAQLEVRHVYAQGERIDIPHAA
ncbi:MAG: N-acetylglucosamine-6-phosphate deacetylase [Burkholderiales bacterium]|nr:N-acetylglucosamine-6-phosphate deacetylase [Burkholderiales bacterium]